MSINESKSSNVVTQEAKVQNALARSAIYRFLFLCFFEPSEKVFPVFKSDEYLSDVQEGMNDYLTLNSFNGKATEMKENLLSLGNRLKEKSFEDLSSEYREVLETFTAAKECPMYETLYGSTDAFQLTQDTQELADIGGFYRAFDLKLSDDIKERYDHIGIELEFMHFLTYKEAYALENHGEEQLKICTDAEKKFLKSHLARWVPLFTMLVNKRAKKDDAYLGIAADLLREFISFETKLLKVKVEEATELNAEALKQADFQCGPGLCEGEAVSKSASE